jgi:DNA-binding transcriptional LysR family regulator
VPLFERRPRALLLTPAGERLQRAVELAFAELRAVATELRGGDEPTLTLATTQAFASFWLIPRLEDFRRAIPASTSASRRIPAWWISSAAASTLRCATCRIATPRPVRCACSAIPWCRWPARPT